MAENEAAIEQCAESGADGVALVAALTSILQRHAQHKAQRSVGTKPSERTCVCVAHGVECFVRRVPDAALVGARGTEGDTLLHVACRHAYAPAVRLLLAVDGAEALLRVRAGGGCAPLHTAAAHGFLAGVRALVGAGAEVGAVERTGATALLLAVRARALLCAKELLTKKADVNASDAKGLTALHWAALTGDEHGVRLLLAFRANINSVTKRTQTPLHMATREGNVGVLQLLLSRCAKRHVRDDFGETPADIARRHRDPQVLRAFSTTTSIAGRKDTRKTVLTSAQLPHLTKRAQQPQQH